MDSRRDFIRKASLLGAGSTVAGSFASIHRALAIDPAPGTSWHDAEHVVILMQENRSFDHCYGALRGVRGFNDPRAISLPNGRPVWLQSTADGATYAPFRLNIRDTRATWMRSLPHSWVDQTDAHNGGRLDGWLEAKRSGDRAFARMPLTLGFYDRNDLPFYYALADAFTICDQNFCSSLTGTTPNRLHLWTGTLRGRPSPDAKANVRNEDVDYDNEVSWYTFPERLEDAGISWRIYQNEISLESGLRGEADAWLANFTDNPIEWFSQYQVRFAPAHRAFLERTERELPAEIARLEALPASPARTRDLARARQRLAAIRTERSQYTEDAFARLSPRQRSLHDRAFTNNNGDPDYRQLASLTYRDGDAERRMSVPKGDVLHRFREDVRDGRLPAVSWIVAPENFSDHPGAPWYGAWYLSECLDILTRDPEVWRKTIFILCYDENDGYFDHVPPFIPPTPGRTDTGKVSPGIDPAVEWVHMAQEDERQKQHPGSQKRSGPVGLGFRVPLVIASPWSRGGFVNSQVFDHTSIVRFLEHFASRRSGRPVVESNISTWRRTVCGDLTSVFRPHDGQRHPTPEPIRRDPFLSSIHQAQFRQLPDGFHRLSEAEIAQALANPRATPALPRQEPGSRPACALPYELTADASLSPDARSLSIRLHAGNQVFGHRAAGAPFHLYSPAPVAIPGAAPGQRQPGRCWDYAVAAGDAIVDQWQLADFADGLYHLRVHGPNGFYREFAGRTDDPRIELALPGAGPGWQVELTLRFTGKTPLRIEVVDLAYGQPSRTLSANPGVPLRIPLDLRPTHGWYDFAIRVQGFPAFLRRYAGHFETGQESTSDPLLA